MEVSREWLAFLREQFPVGSRIRLREMQDPHTPVPPGTMGTLESIDDAGQFHMKWDNGRFLALTIGVDSFTVLPPDPQTLKFYMPLTGVLYGEDEWGDREEYGSELDGQDLRQYETAIREALQNNQMPEEKQRGLMHWYGENDAVNDKVLSAVFQVESRAGQLWGVAECRVLETLTLQERETLMEYLSGQASDGWGEGFEQRPISVGDQELYVSFWNDGAWSIQTEQERFEANMQNRLPDICWSVLPGEGTLICIQRGETGYTVSDWNTDDPEHNRKLADYRNRKRGITPEQEQNMLNSLPDWEMSGADDHQTDTMTGGMTLE